MPKANNTHSLFWSRAVLGTLSFLIVASGAPMAAMSLPSRDARNPEIWFSNASWEYTDYEGARHEQRMAAAILVGFTIAGLLPVLLAVKVGTSRTARGVTVILGYSLLALGALCAFVAFGAPALFVPSGIAFLVGIPLTKVGWDDSELPSNRGQSSDGARQ
jgi:hypothetical protein